MEISGDHEMPTALTLSQFSRYVAQALSRQPVLMGAWVTAEISDMSTSGGHCYMTLLEKDANGTTVARMRATIWANRFIYLREKFLRATGQPLVNGMKVMLYGGANYHINYGLSFNVGEIDPSYTMGDLERIRREILMTLRREGVIERNRSLPVGEPPQRIAVISSEKAAGYGDFMKQLENNALAAQFYTMLFPAVMQGERTAESVLRALELVEQTLGIVGWDCVVIIRGGGSTTDMTGFDNIELARRVATFPIPVVVGIGHERDRCVLDEIACVRCKTPTAVASWIIDTAGAWWQRATDLATRAATYAAERLKGEHIRMQGLETMLPVAADTRLRDASTRIRTISTQLPLIAGNVTSQERLRLRNTGEMLRMWTGTVVESNSTRLESLAANLRVAATMQLDREQTALENVEKMIGVLSPDATLRRGYSIARVGGRAVTDPSQVKAGEVMVTRTAGGDIISRISDGKSGNEN